MSFELENPELAGLVVLYKDGQIAYQDAKDKIAMILIYDKSQFIESSADMDELKQKAKELLLGNGNSNVK